MVFYANALRSAERMREMRKAPEGASRDEIASAAGRRHVLVYWTVPAEKAEDGVEYHYHQVFRADEVGKNNRAKGGARAILEGPSFERWRFERSLAFVRSALANDELYQ